VLTTAPVTEFATPTRIAVVRLSLGARRTISWETTVTVTGRVGTLVRYVRHERLSPVPHFFNAGLPSINSNTAPID